MNNLKVCLILSSLFIADPALADEFQALKREFRTLPAEMGCTGMLTGKKAIIDRRPRDPLFDYYEDISRRLGQAGTHEEPKSSEYKQLICSLTLTPKGEISDLKVAKSSGSAVIDANAEQLIKAAAPYTARDPAVTKGNHVFWIIFFDFPNVDRSQVYVKTAPSGST